MKTWSPDVFKEQKPKKSEVWATSFLVFFDCLSPTTPGRQKVVCLPTHSRKLIPNLATRHLLGMRGICFVKGKGGNGAKPRSFAHKGHQPQFLLSSQWEYKEFFREISAHLKSFIHGGLGKNIVLFALLKRELPLQDFSDYTFYPGVLSFPPHKFWFSFLPSQLTIKFKQRFV